MSDTPKPLAPPYIAFKTLLGVFDKMEKEGIPPQIDRSFLTGMSGGYQTQVLNALRYLGLIKGEEGTVAEELLEVVSSETRKKSLATILWNRYPEPARMGEENATQGQLATWFREQFNLAAETQDKAVAFYLQAANYAEIPVSPFFKKPRVSSGTRKRTRRKAPVDKTKQPPAENPETPKVQGKSMFKVALEGGGTVTLLGDFDPFALAPEERTFVFGLVDDMRKHQESSGLDLAEDPEAEDDEDDGGENP